jgi:hypothetical protein
MWPIDLICGEDDQCMFGVPMISAYPCARRYLDGPPWTPGDGRILSRDIALRRYSVHHFIHQ